MNPDLLLFIVIPRIRRTLDELCCRQTLCYCFLLLSVLCCCWSHVDFCFRLLPSLELHFHRDSCHCCSDTARPTRRSVIPPWTRRSYSYYNELSCLSASFRRSQLSLTSCIVLVLNISLIPLLHDSYCILYNMTYIHTTRHFWVRRVDFKSFLTLIVLGRAVVLFVRSGQCANYRSRIRGISSCSHPLYVTRFRTLPTVLSVVSFVFIVKLIFKIANSACQEICCDVRYFN